MSSKRLALCVGINAYASSPLRGCVNDAADWSLALHDRGYEVSVLLDNLATHAAILGELRQMVSEARWGTRIVFTFSGHGTYTVDRDGDEADGRDEALCPFDYQRRLILDDELAVIAAQVPRGARLTILSDSCHSGTVSRFVGGPAGRVRFLPPASIPDMTGVEGHGVAVDLEREVAPSARSRHGAVLISGCDDPEYSYDANIGGRPRGAFTAAALDALAASPRASVGAWYGAIRRRLPSSPAFPYPQTPQLTASRYQRFSRAL